MFKFTNSLNKNNDDSLISDVEHPQIDNSEQQSPDSFHSSIEEELDLFSDDREPQKPQNKSWWQKPQAILSTVGGKIPKKSKKFWFGMGLLITLGGTSGAGYWVWQKVESTLPDSVDVILTYTRPGTMTIQASDGTVLQELGPVSHEQLKIWQIPESVIEAFIASEDQRFYSHNGVDFQGLTRAAWVNFQSNKIVEGGSTITQQLSRIVFLNTEKNLWRKLREMRIAQKVEENFDKQQILERYLNLVYLGSGAYGVADAAWIYFGKSIDQLTLPEIATIAGIAPAPSLYSPLENLDNAKERRNLVLQNMAKQGFITPEEAQTAIASELKLNSQNSKRLDRKIPYFTDYIQKEIPKYVTPEQLQQGGLIVETSLDLQWQQIAEETVKTAVADYGSAQNFSQGALVAIDPRSGQIKAMVGGKDFEENEFNRVTQAQRQPGSTFKTFLYAAAIAGGKSPYDGFLNAKYVIDGYKPENYGDTYSDSYLSMRDALIQSTNVIAVRVLVDVGWEPLMTTAQKMGIKSNLKQEYAVVLGSSEVNLLELTSAYGTIANQGIHQEAHGISRILDRNGKVIYQAPLSKEEAIDPDTASILTWMLRGVVNNGTGTNASLSDRQVAGKTGTSDDFRDLWFIGYIPQVVTGVWLGNDDNSATWGTSNTAALVWRNFMREITKDLTVESFPELPNLNGRKGSIKLEPIKPKSSYYVRQPKPEPAPETTYTVRNNNRNRPSRNPNNNTNNNNRRNNPPQSSPESNPTPRRTNTPAPTPKTQTAPPPVTAPAPAPVPAPVAAPAPVEAPVAPVAPVEAPAALPAPPADRKEE